MAEEKEKLQVSEFSVNACQAKLAPQWVEIEPCMGLEYQAGYSVECHQWFSFAWKLLTNPHFYHHV